MSFKLHFPCKPSKLKLPYVYVNMPTAIKRESSNYSWGKWLCCHLYSVMTIDRGISWKPCAMCWGWGGAEQVSKSFQPAITGYLHHRGFPLLISVHSLCITVRVRERECEAVSAENKGRDSELCVRELVIELVGCHWWLNKAWGDLFNNGCTPS